MHGRPDWLAECHTCMPGRPCSTSTATTCGPAATRRRWPRCCACSSRSAIAAPAVRTAISRMVLQGWLAPATLPAGRGYAATEQAIQRLDSAAERIYRTTRRRLGRPLAPGRSSTRSGSAPTATRVRGRPAPGSGTPSSATASGSALAAARARRAAPPREGDRVARHRHRLRPGHDAGHLLGPRRARGGVRRLAGPGAHRGRDAEDRATTPTAPRSPRRFQLVHEWRKFLFRDPGLPDELLPAAWPGREAAAHFTAEAERLKPGADRFVDRCLA